MTERPSEEQMERLREFAEELDDLNPVENGPRVDAIDAALAYIEAQPEQKWYGQREFWPSPVAEAQPLDDTNKSSKDHRRVWKIGVCPVHGRGMTIEDGKCMCGARVEEVHVREVVEGSKGGE